MNYLLCPECGSLLPATISTSARITCAKCGFETKIKKLCCKMCPDCQSLLYSLPAELEMAVFPCAAKHAEEKERRRRRAEEERKAVDTAAAASPSEPEPVEPAEPAAPETGVDESPANPYPPIPCEICGAMMKPKGSEYPVCPSCGSEPSRAYIHEQLYKLGGPLAPLQIKWHPEHQEMMHIDRNSAAIPPYSVVIVGEDQVALYKAGGSSIWLTGGNTYPLFDDLRTEDQIVEGIYRGNAMEDSLGYRIDTTIIFFDKRIQSTAFTASLTLPDGVWQVSLPVSVGVQLSEPETLMQNSLNLSDAETMTRELIGYVQTAVSKEISQRLLDIPDESMAEARKASDVRRLLRNAVALESAAIRQRVNLELVPRYGVQAAFLEVDVSAAELLNTEESDRVACPVCHAENWVPKGSKNSFSCRKCGSHLSWCITCGAYTTTRLTARHTKECVKCGFEKF